MGARGITYEEFRRQRYFPFIDGLRAIAVGFVILEHARGHAVWRWVSGGTNGVTIFFVISGFLITTLCLREEDRRGTVDVKGFLIRRLFRIVPLYALVLGVYCLLILRLRFEAGRQGLFLHALPYYASPLPEVPFFTRPQVPFEIAWSLGIEEKFYFVWPLLVFVFARRMARARLAGSIVLAGLLIAAFVVSADGRWTFQYVHILFGCAAALGLHDRRLFERLRPLAHPALMGGALAVVASLHLLGFIVPPELMFLYSAGVAVLLIGALIGRPGGLRLIGSPPLVFIGRISFGLYLTHQIGLHAAARAIPASLGFVGDALALGVGVGIAIALSYALHICVERPLIRVGRALSSRRAAPWPAVQPGASPAE